VSYPCQPTKRGGEFPGSNDLVMTPAENNPLSPSRTIGLLIRTIFSNPFQQNARGFIVWILRNQLTAKSLAKVSYLSWSLEFKEIIYGALSSATVWNAPVNRFPSPFIGTADPMME
jgi:hypothetical protein